MNIGIPVLNRYDKLELCIQSIRESTIPAKITIVDNGGKLSPELDFSVMHPGRNLGVAKSWNLLLQTIEEPLIICNDDIEFGKNDIKSFYDAYQTSDAGVFYTDNIEFLNMFSCFMIRPATIEKIGYFDEEFYPAYFEDCDYFWRMTLADIKWQSIPTNIQHTSSSTLAAYTDAQMKQHHEDFRRNRGYYVRKWGNEPKFEKYRTAFNR